MIWTLFFCFGFDLSTQGRVSLSSSRIPFSSWPMSFVLIGLSSLTMYSFSFSYRGCVSWLMISRSFVMTRRPSVSLSRRPIGFRPILFRSFGIRRLVVSRLNGSVRVVM